jgi:hypothetical protein
MTFDFQTWMRAVWTGIMEPSDSARKVIAMDIPREALWTALMLIAVLNVLLVEVLKLLSPAPAAFEQQAFAMSPFGFFAIISVFLVVLVFGVSYAGRMMGGKGTLPATLAIVVWFQSISLTVQIVQIVLIVISPAIGSIFGLLSLGALIWCFINFINILHGFNHLGKAFGVLVLAFIGAGIILTVLGFGAVGGMA